MIVTIVFYENGHVCGMTPRPLGKYYDNRDAINSATTIFSDGVQYDLTNIDSIHSIAIPNYQAYTPKLTGDELGVTGHLDYVLRMRSGQYWNNCEYELAIACLEKATQLMKYSTIGWPRKDFYRIVNELNDLGQFKKALRWKKWIEYNIPHENANEKEDLYLCCKALETDLVQVGDSDTCCAKCAMYRKRIYSISGKDKRFPKFPDDFHSNCGLSAHPFVYGISRPTFKCWNIILYSRRKFKDDRSESEKENYETWQKMLKQLPPVIREPKLPRIIYFRLKKLLPDDAPKTMSGFMRMYNANSKRYQALVKKAEAIGFVFPESLDDVAKWENN